MLAQTVEWMAAGSKVRSFIQPGIQLNLHQ